MTTPTPKALKTGDRCTEIVIGDDGQPVTITTVIKAQAAVPDKTPPGKPAAAPPAKS